jgi:hypothetical protein
VLAAWAGLAAALLLGGCAGGGAGAGVAEADRLCAPHALANARAVAPADPPLPPEAFQAIAAPLAARGYSRPALEVADAIGALGPLRRLTALQGAARPGGTAAALERLRLRQLVGERIMLAMLDANAAVAELDCEGERGDQLQTRLQGIESRRARRLTLASILAGALTAGMTGGLSLGAQETAASLAGIVGGATEASLAGSLLFGGASGPLRTERNMLAELWERPEQARLYPETVWRYLTRRRNGADGQGGTSVADVLVAEWRAGDRFGPPGSEEERARIALLFGPGGTYSIEDLEVREALLELVQAGVALMSQDLRLLLTELQASGPF